MTRFAKSALLLGALGVILLALGAPSATGAKPHLLKSAALGQIRPAFIKVKIHRHGRVYTVKRRMPFISPGTIAAARQALALPFASRAARARLFANAAPGGPDEKALGADAASGNGTNANGNDNANNAGLGISLGTYGCSRRLGNANGDQSQGQGDQYGNGRTNVRVNQDCTFRRQAEETIRYNPADPKNLLAGQNDSRVGYNQCGIDYSLNNGKNWGDLLPPFRQKLNNPAGQEPTPADPNRHTILGGPGTFHTYDAGSDPIATWDSRGRGFFGCVAFDVASNASMLYVTQSPRGAHGSFFFNLSTFSRRFVVAEDNNAAVFHDKPFVVADQNPNSPNRDNVYVTWTVFRFSPQCGPQPNPGAEERYCSSPIFGSMSTDHGVHWSTPELISGTSDALCFFGNFFDPTAPPGACNFDQGSDPAVLPNGDLEVIFNNGNTPPGDVNSQQLGVHCHPTGDSRTGTARLNCAAPSFVGRDIAAGEPLCDFGRGPEECIPGAYIRTNDFPRITPNPTSNTLFATWQDYQRRDNPAVKEFSIQMTRSTDGGLTWEPVRTINPDTGLDHYFPAVDVCKRYQNTGDRYQSFDNNGNGNDQSSCENSRVGDSYYRTERVPGEANTANCLYAVSPATCTPFAPGTQAGVGTSNSDYVLAGGTWPNTPFNFKVISPVFPPPDGNQAGFNGDYSGLTIQPLGNGGEDWNGNACSGNGSGYGDNANGNGGGGCVHPIWSDTRNVDPYSSPQRTAEAGGVNNGVVHDEDIFTDALGLPNGTSQVFVGQVGRGGDNNR